MSVIQLLVDMEYLKRGLIPWSHYNSDEERNSLDRRLEEMSPEESRISKRKFRKAMRSEIRKGRRVNKKSYWSRQYVVYHSISDKARKKFRDMRDNDT